MINVSPAEEEEVEVDVEERGEKEEGSEHNQSGDENPSTSLEHSKQEVRMELMRQPFHILSLHNHKFKCVL